MDRAVLTPARDADAAGVTALVAALESALYGQTTFSQADLEDEWSDVDLRRMRASSATATASSGTPCCTSEAGSGASTRTSTPTRSGAGSAR